MSKGRHGRRAIRLEPLESRQLLAVVISEFMASNQTTLTDDFGDYSDWIELHNRGEAAVNLQGWSLTDDADELQKWRFPAITLQSGQLLVVHASDRDRTAPSARLHTNFRLSAEGEYLALVRADGRTIESSYAPWFPAQVEDVSYGLSADGQRQGFFLVATPGQPNVVEPLPDASNVVVISELMYSLPRPTILDAEDKSLEFVELHNRGTTAIDVTGWRFTRGINFTIPAATIPAGGQLVVAADLPAFRAAYPSVINVVGGWTGTLSNRGETIELVNAAGALVDQLQYANQGDWGTRAEGPLDRGATGWIWTAEHDGQSKSLELINSALPNDNGQNWAASASPGGTPGQINSVAASDIAPLIASVMHSPPLPQSSQSVHVTARVSDELATGMVAQVWWRTQDEAPFESIVMADNGQHGDGLSGDGWYGATLPAQPNLTVVEYYVEVRDATGLARTWPAPTAAGLQQTNALYQVFDAFDASAPWQPGTPPIYHLIMTPTERARFTNIQRLSNAQFNATFIAVTGTGIDVRYNAGVRVRGSGSRNDPIPNNRVNLPSDQPWQGVNAINLNQRNPVAQIAGSTLYRLAGVPAADVHAVRLFSNGIDLKNGGYYVHAEVVDSEYAENHFPTDSDGNLYRGRRDDDSPPGGQGAGLLYMGPDPLPYVSYEKESNGSAADWSDVIELTYRLNITPDSEYVDAVREVVDVSQWFRTIAIDSLMDNGEFGLLTGDPEGDDYGMYRGTSDTRFRMIPYDWDTLFGNPNETLFPANRVVPLTKLIMHPEFLPEYYAQYLDVIEQVLLNEQTGAVLDQALQHVASMAQIDNIKQFLARRADYVLRQIDQQLTVTTDLETVDGVPRSTSASFTLAGIRPEANARAVRVGNDLAVFGSQRNQGNWTYSSHEGTNSLRLTPGMNRLPIRAYVTSTGVGTPLAETSIDLWYDTGRETLVTGSLEGATTWTVEQGPYRVRGDVVVASSAVLTIEPGTTVFFENDARLTVNGGLVAIGSADSPIWFTRLPGHASWRGIQFESSSHDNRIERAIVQYGITDDGMIGVTNSRLTIERSILDHTDRRRIRSIDSSLIVSNSTFTDIFEPGQAPTTDNLNEHIWGRGIPVDGQWIVQGNTFGTITGHNDAIDFDAPQTPGRFAQILNNRFLGGGDDALDLTGNFWIEGNRFANYLKDEFNADPGHSNTISSSSGEFWVIRNVFDQVHHAALIKEEAFMHFLNNTVVKSELAPLYFDLRGQTSGPGRGARVEGSIFAQVPTTFDQVLPSTDLQVNFSFLPKADEGLVTGLLNQFGDPHIAGADDDYRLRPGSPAQGMGPGAIDMGAAIPAGAQLWGVPAPVTNQTSATLFVSGPGLVEYRYQLDNQPVSAAESIAQPVRLSNLSAGSHQLRVWGRDGVGNWQAQPTLSSVWRVAPDLSHTVRLNEVLADNQSAFTHAGQFNDAVELYNYGGAAVDLSGFSLTDQPELPRQFVFPAGAMIHAGGYLVLHADDRQTAPGLHLGFGLNRQGDGLYLFSPTGELIDSVAFGAQLPDLSLGRWGREGTWTLTQPTFGNANRQTPLGDPSHVRINEWFANGDIRLTQDMLELFNPQDYPVAIGGYSLTDEPFAMPTRSVLPASTFIGGAGYLPLIADGNPEDGSDHLNFSLSAVHEHLALFSPRGQRIDQVFYYGQTREVSQGRVEDGAPSYAFRPVPTFGASNGTAAAERITVLDIGWDEVWKYEASGADLGVAWRQAEFDDTGWSAGPGLLGNENEAIPAPLRTEIPLGQLTYYFRKTIELDTDVPDLRVELTTIIDDGVVVYVNGQEVLRNNLPAGEIDYQTRASSNIGEGQIEGPFATPKSVWIDGTNVIAVEVHQAAISSTDLLFGLQLTATASVVDDEADQVERVVDQLRITELMYRPSAGNGAEYLELQNIGNQTLDLSGVRLSGGIEFEFPVGTQLEPLEFVVVTDNVVAFRQVYGQAVNVAGQYSGRLSDEGEEIVLQLATPIDTAILRFSYEPGWHPASNGQGASLSVIDPSGDFRHWGQAQNWLPTAPSPGRDPNAGPAGDLTGDGVVDVADIDRLCLAVRRGEAVGDLNGDGRSDLTDLDLLILDLLATTFGDANLDGRFNSSDIVQIFATGHYEDAFAGNSTWSDGDWNCDGDFDTRDLVVAFQHGGYVAAVRPDAVVMGKSSTGLRPSDVAGIGIDAANLDRSVERGGGDHLPSGTSWPAPIHRRRMVGRIEPRAAETVWADREWVPGRELGDHRVDEDSH